MSNPNKGLLIALAVLVLAAVAWGILTMPDHRTTGQKIGDAVDTLPQGVDKAGRQLQDRTPGARLGDAVKDAGQNIKNSTND